MLTPNISVQQNDLFGLCPITDAVRVLTEAGTEERGAVFTRREVVDFMLDLVGYGEERSPLETRLLEPSFGDGDFLIPAIERLLVDWNQNGRPDPLAALSDRIFGVELHRKSFEGTRERVVDCLLRAGLVKDIALTLADRWLVFSDFLLMPSAGCFDVVVGNPPYIRQELISDALMEEYRRRYETIYDRADIYVPFFERGLKSLEPSGMLCFICADRWMKNRYGGPLRELVSSGFWLKSYVDMVDTPAFHSDVIAYPAITVIERGSPGSTRIAKRPKIESETLKKLARNLRSTASPSSKSTVFEALNVPSGREPWLLEAADKLELVRRLERDFASIEEVGCTVGIGVASGADKAFIGPFEELDVEADRKLPLAMTRDIVSGSVVWRGYGIINPFGDDGKLVDLDQYPRLRSYLEARREVIAGRHIAQRDKKRWYRTIDRIWSELTTRQKLLIPDIKGEANIVFEEGKLYPHHNLYWITSEDWEVRALQAVLKSGMARFFVSAYSTKMRGGFLRFQAQYLRKIRLPSWASVPVETRRALSAAAESDDQTRCQQSVSQLYGLNDAEERLVFEGL